LTGTRISVPSSRVPDNVAAAAEAIPLGPRRRRPFSRGRALRASVPYWLIVPVLAVMAAILGYPLYNLVTLSFQKYGLFELIQRKGPWIGLDNYSSVLHDPVFWDTLARTVVFTVVNVGLTIVLGTLTALLLVQVSPWVRVLLTTGLVLVWSMPAVVAVQVWYWMTNFQNGILNYALTELHVGDYFHHDWYATTTSKLAMVTLLIVWGALPFVTITVYAGLAQVPGELVVAAEIDGAGPLRVFRDVTFPILKPILLILTSLSIIWDFGVFTQPYLLIGAEHVDSSNFLMGVYVFIEGYKSSDFGRGAAISILMLLMVAAMSFFYVRKMVRLGDVR
jgi:N,N'-diacetylchitobiose transport system permease protein